MRTPAKILVSELLALVRFVGTLQRRIHCTVPLFTNTFELFRPKTSTELPSRNRTRRKKLTMYECLRRSFNGRKCLSCNGISCKGADQLDYSLGCLKGISDNIPTLASHGMKFIEILIQNTQNLEVYSISDLPCAQAYSHLLEVQSKFSRYKSGRKADIFCCYGASVTTL